MKVKYASVTRITSTAIWRIKNQISSINVEVKIKEIQQSVDKEYPTVRRQGTGMTEEEDTFK